MSRRQSICGFMLSYILLCFTFVANAQTGSFVFVNESNANIDRAAVERAAQPLIDQYGARVAVYAVISGNSRDFRNRLTDDNLISFAVTGANSLGIYIATEEQYSEIRWGSDFDKIDGGWIRRDALNPGLRDRDFTGALVNALQTIHGEMNNPLTSLKHILGQLLSNPLVLMIIGLAIYVYIRYKLGFGWGDSSSYNDNSDSSWSSSSSSGGGSWGGGSDSGGGSDGGSWSD